MRYGAVQLGYTRRVHTDSRAGAHGFSRPQNGSVVLMGPREQSSCERGKTPDNTRTCSLIRKGSTSTRAHERHHRCIPADHGGFSRGRGRLSVGSHRSGLTTPNRDRNSLSRGEDEEHGRFGCLFRPVRPTASPRRYSWVTDRDGIVATGSRPTEQLFSVFVPSGRACSRQLRWEHEHARRRRVARGRLRVDERRR
jgi:hypothetical protein